MAPGSLTVTTLDRVIPHPCLRIHELTLFIVQRLLHRFERTGFRIGFLHYRSLAASPALQYQAVIGRQITASWVGTIRKYAWRGVCEHDTGGPAMAPEPFVLRTRRVWP